MEHEMTVHLTEEEYSALSEEAKQTGKEIEDMIHELLAGLARHVRPSHVSPHPLSMQEVLENLYDEGVLASVATGEPLTKEEEAELKRLGELFGQGKPLSEMIIEDRGPY